MKNVRLLFLVFWKFQPIKARICERPIVVSGLVASPRRNRIDAQAKQIVRKRLKKGQCLLIGLVESLGWYASSGKQIVRNIAVVPRALNGLRTAIAQQRAPAGLKFVALRVPAKIVVIVQNQNPRILSRSLAVKICRRQPANPSANNNQIVCFSAPGRRSERIPALSIAKLMRIRECTVVIAAHPGQRRRIVARRFFRSRSSATRVARSGSAASNPPATNATPFRQSRLVMA